MLTCIVGLFYFMGRGINTTKINKEYILSKVSQITIFSVYFNLSDKIINHCIETGELICSPIREDSHPTCGFRYDNKGKLKFRDFAGYFWGDCFDAAALILSTISNKKINISNKNDFIKVLTYITFTFKDIFYGSDKDPNLTLGIESAIEIIKKQKPVIEIVVREWNDNDIKYWKQYGINLQLLNINFIYAVDQYYIDRKINPEPKYYYKSEDPCYAYLLGKDRNNINNIKLYFPNRKHTNIRFICNCNHLEGIYNLDRNDYDYIILTKSTKDRLSIVATLNTIVPFTGKQQKVKVGVINIPHETYHLRQFEYEWLQSKLNENGNIISLMDTDSTGIKEAKWLRNRYDIIPLIIPNKYKAKDFSELVVLYDKKTIKNYILETYNFIKDYGNHKEHFRYKEKNDTQPF